MLISEVCRLLDGSILTGDENIGNEVKSACGSDLMSDVLAFVKDQGLLLTGLINPQVVRTAAMMDMKCIIFVRGKQPDEAILKLADQWGLVIMTTPHRMYNACGLLYAGGLGRNEADG